MSDRTCSIDGCDRKFYARTWCELHYTRWRVHGDPRSGAQRFSDPKQAIKARTSRDAATGCLVWHGALCRKGYARLKVDDRHVSVHRYVWEREYGPIPAEMVVDHTCYNRACLEISHLRVTSSMKNTWNRSGPTSASSSGIRNVYPRRGKYYVAIKRDGVMHNFGTFVDIEDAARVAEVKRYELFGEYAGRG